MYENRLKNAQLTARKSLPYTPFLAISGQIFAHHGSASYSDKQVVLKKATVTKFVWANPHSVVMVDVKDECGKTSHWA